MNERDFDDDLSSYDEILDFDLRGFQEEEERIAEDQESDSFYRTLDEY